MAHQPRDVMSGLEAWRGNGHMGAMCSARARALVQDFDETGRGGRGKMRKNQGKIWVPMANP